MKILFIHNKYGKYSGEEAVVDGQIDLLLKNGHQVCTYFRSSEELKEIAFGKFKAFFTALYNPVSIRELTKIIEGENPDIIHIHNLYPLISPAVLRLIRKYDIPVVMTVHNYRLVCPNGLFYNQKEICESCSGGREWNCIKNNCENSLFKSTGYALRNWFARFRKYYLDNVDCFACLTEFQKGKLVADGYPKERIVVIPNMYNQQVHDSDKDGKGGYMAVVGRVSPEKGIPVLLDAARFLPDIPFKIAGGIREGYSKQLNIPSNVQFLGNLNKEELDSFYLNAKVLIHSSRVYEGFPMVFPEAMNHKLPIIAPNMAGYPEIVEHNYNGLLFEPGDSLDLAKKIKELWYDGQKCNLLGENGHKRMLKNYTSNSYFEKLSGLYFSLLNPDSE